MGLSQARQRKNNKVARGPAFATVFVAIAITSCSGEKPGDDGTGAGPAPCDGFCATQAPQRLEIADVDQILSQAAQQASVRGAPATVAVVDRVGNVLAVGRVAGAPLTVRIGSPEPIDGGLEGVSLVPSELSAISKAITGAYLSSEGNAFSTRTASQIVQANFDPGEIGQPGGPLSGVQFSQLPCSDLATRFTTGVGPGPHRSPLGLSADPGGFPLYKNGTLVGGVGVEADGVYTLDADIADRDDDVDEGIAMAASFGFAAPRDRRADHITVDGKTLRFSDVEFPASGGGGAPPATPVAVAGYTDGTVIAGTAFTQAASGFAAATDPDFAERDAFLLVDGGGVNRFPASPGTDGLMTMNEVRTLLLSALDVAKHARAQIRQPLGLPARVSISVVDTNGALIGVARSRDAPVFGTDVSLQKARTAMFFSKSSAAATLQALPPAHYLQPDQPAPLVLRDQPIGDYVAALQDFIGVPTALDGSIAFSARAIGNLARPFYPDGVEGEPAGPLAKAQGQWSPFSDGLQLDLVYNAIVAHVAFVAGLSGTDTPQNCTGVPALANGMQIFAGGVPIYRGNQLVGGIGVSGDGIDQDDLVAFLGLHDASVALGGSIGNAAAAIRADQLVVHGVNLRYVQCPQAPFLDSDDTHVCDSL
jgi:uncharacterized protein GlcG (DUF336 family)